MEWTPCVLGDGVRRGLAAGGLEICRRFRSSRPRLGTRAVYGEFGRPRKICPRACVWKVPLSAIGGGVVNAGTGSWITWIKGAFKRRRAERD